MLVNMSINSSVNWMLEPKHAQTHQFQCTMPMIIGLMEMNRTPMTQRIITLNLLLLTKLNRFAFVSGFFLSTLSGAFRTIRFNANTVFNRFFMHYCCFCCCWHLCWLALPILILIPIEIVLPLLLPLALYLVLCYAIAISAAGCSRIGFDFENEHFGPPIDTWAASLDVKWRFKWIERYSN